MICVPTPLTPQREPDMSYVVDTSRAVQARLRKGQLVVLESTTYPGTTDELVRGILEKSGLVAGRDFYLAFSPEREDPGNPTYKTANIPKVVGGVDADSGDLAEALYQQAISCTVRVSSARAAEAAKLTENIFRAVNIALVNELKVVYDAMGIDVWEVLDAASTKPFGFMRFNPGPGWGGHCIPLDPFYLAWKAREFGRSTKFIELAGEVNVEMPHYVVQKLLLALNDRGRAVKGARVLILGLAYKKDIDDPRESPAFELIEAHPEARRFDRLSRPARTPRAEDARLAAPAGDGVGAVDTGAARRSGCRGDRHRSQRRGLRARRRACSARRGHTRHLPGASAECREGMTFSREAMSWA